MADNPWGDTVPQAAPAARAPAANPWSEEVKSDAVSDEMANHSGITDDLRNFFKFGGHGTARGLMETIGFPVDSYNSAAYFAINHPEAMMLAGGEGTVSPEDIKVSEQAEKEIAEGKGPKHEPIYTGSTQSIKDVSESLGLKTPSPEEAGVHSGWADWGYTLGEFGGANLPFVVAAPERIAVEAGSKVVSNLERILSLEGKTKLGVDRRLSAAGHDLFFGAIGPGTGAAVGQEFTGEDYKGIGKAAGAVAGGFRFPLIGAAFHYGKQGASWMHDFLGLGTGAEAKVGEALVSGTQRPAEAAAALAEKKPLSPGAKIPVDIQAGDEGLIALRRSVAANDAILSGQYHEMQHATQRAILADTKLNRANFASTQDWLEAKQKHFESLAQQRLRQAEQQAERDVDTALSNTQTNPNDAILARQVYALTLRNQMVFARDDLKAVTDEKWSKVDKALPIETHLLYDDIRTMKKEHEARPGESDKRFPGEFVDRFFEKTKDETSGKMVETPKFGPSTKLQDVIDLDSEVQQQIRIEMAKDAPDRVYTSYLSRLSQALNRAKGTARGAEQNAPLKDALAATKYFHQTFSQGPVGQLLGLEETGASRVFAGDSIKHFISQGPGGVDNFSALVKAMQARSGKVHPMMSGMDMPTMLRNDIRQQFADAAMNNGQFNVAAAKKFMRNNAAPLTHFEDLRKEFESAIQSGGSHSSLKSAVEKKQDVDSVRAKNVDLFLNKPGELFNGALEARNQYAKTKEILKLAEEDPTGRATEGLVQKAFDHMWQTSQTVDKTVVPMDRLDGRSVNKWVEKNKGVIRALDEAMPGVKERFDRIAKTAEYLERFQVKPDLPESTGGFKMRMMQATTLLARIMGANIFSKFGERGGSIQTAAIGSQAFKQLAEQMTPERATKIFRRAMVEPEFFKALTTEITEKNAAEKFRVIQPYLYSMGIPLVQPSLEESQPQPKRRGAQ